MAKKVKLGLIGCGGFMHEHVQRLKAVKAAQIAALTDPNKRNSGRLVKSFPQLAPLPTFKDYRDMLEAVELDGAVIATPHSLHFEQIMTCLDAGLHVLCEKPLVCCTDHAKKVMRKAERKGLVLMVAYQRHFLPIFRQARKIVAEGKLGRITFANALLAQEWLKATKGTWRQDPELSCGGELNDSGSHMLDAILWVTGLVPETVYAAIDNRGALVDILSAVTIKFKGGAIGSLSVVGDAPGWWEEITFYGERGALYVRGDRLYHHTPRRGRWGGPDVSDLTAKLRGGSNPNKNFVDSILGRDEPQTPPIWGLRVIQLTEAAWESARSGKPAKVKH